LGPFATALGSHQAIARRAEQVPVRAAARRNEDDTMRLDQAAKSLFLREFVGAIILSMRYFFKPK
jgi:hypothetical protein